MLPETILDNSFPVAHLDRIDKFEPASAASGILVEAIHGIGCCGEKYQGSPIVQLHEQGERLVAIAGMLQCKSIIVVMWAIWEMLSMHHDLDSMRGEGKFYYLLCQQQKG